MDKASLTLKKCVILSNPRGFAGKENLMHVAAAQSQLLPSLPQRRAAATSGQGKSLTRCRLLSMAQVLPVACLPAGDPEKKLA